VSNHPRPTGRGDTPPSARRWFLERFQAGELRVLCNHSVLTTDFDAPKTDMVLIARQVISPVRYMQMVDRGLRGTRNGGTERCRIVTGLDDLGRFSDRQPFHYCQRFFVPETPARPDELVSQGRTTRSFSRRACRVQHRLQRA
jgi:superfamily II DNA or RNA helicase